MQVRAVSNLHAMCIVSIVDMVEIITTAKKAHMDITLYGTWGNRIDGASTDLKTSVSDWLGGLDDRYDIEAIADHYREAVVAALPDGVFMAGEEFLGPAYGDGHVDVDWDAISQIVADIDLWAIADQHQIA